MCMQCVENQAMGTIKLLPETYQIQTRFYFKLIFGLCVFKSSLLGQVSHDTHLELYNSMWGHDPQFKNLRAQELSQWIRALVAKPDNLDSWDPHSGKERNSSCKLTSDLTGTLCQVYTQNFVN